MLAINWKTSWPLVETAIRDHNKCHVVGRRKDGRATYDLKKVLRATHQHLLKEMVRLYSHQLAGLEWLHLTTELPPYRTHCGELATELDVSKGTINNLLNRLLGSGLVVEREHRGRCNKFALRFDPTMIVIHPELERRRQMAQDGDQDGDGGYQAVEGERGENLQQPLDASSFKKENKLSDGTGDKKEKAPTPRQAEASNPALGGRTRASTRLREAWGLGAENEKKGGIGDNEAAKHCLEASNPALGGKEGASDARLQDGREGAETHRGARLESAESPAPAPFTGIFADYCARLVAVMVGTLWSRLDFMATSQMEAIKAFLNGQFVGKTAVEGEATYRQLWIRVGLAEKWVKKKPNRYIPIPSTYLKTDNPNGFDRTAKWLENMRMTSKRAERAKQRYQFLSKSIGAVLHSTGKHLEEQGLHSYVKRRREVTDKYQHLGTAFDWIVLDPRANEDNGNSGD